MREKPHKLNPSNLILPILLGTLLTACGGGSTTPTPTKPTAPTSVTATPKPGYVELTWKSDGTNVKGFDIYRETLPKASTQEVKKQALTLLTSVGSDARSFKDTGVKAGEQYRYAVAAKGESASSEQTTSSTVTPALNTAPIAKAIPDMAVPPGSADKTLDLKTIFSDKEDGTNLTFQVKTNTSASVATAAINNGILTVKFLAVGTTTLTLEATDSAGLTVTQTLKVTVAAGNTPPSAKSIPAVNVASGAAAQTLDLSTFFSDAQDTVLTFAVVSNTDPDVVSPQITGKSLKLTFLSSGTTTLTLKATDSGGLSVNASFTVTVNAPVNTAPTTTGIADVTRTLGQGGAIDFTLSPFFSDLQQASNTLTFTVKNNTNPGVVDVNLSGETVTLIFKSAGQSTVTLRATDAGGLFVETSFKVTVNPPTNTAPTTTGLASVVKTLGDAPTTVDLTTKFSDAQQASNTLTYTVTGNTNPGTVTPLVTGGSLKLTFVEAGSSDLTVRATDAGGLFVETTFKVTVNSPSNQTPTTTGLPAVTVTQGAADTTTDLTAVFNDTEDGKNLTFSVQGNTNTSVVTPSIASGKLTLKFLAAGTSMVTVRATDSKGLFVEASFLVTVKVPNQAPSIFDIPAVVKTVGDAPVTLKLSDFFTDDTGSANLTYALVGNTNASVVTPVVSNGNLTLTFKGAGSATVTVKGTDAEGLSVNNTVMVTVNAANTPPTTTGLPAMNAVEGDLDRTLDLSQYFNDLEDGKNLTFAVVGGTQNSPVVPVINGSILTLKFPNAGVAMLTVRATDSKGLFVETTLRIDVASSTPPSTTFIPEVVKTLGDNATVLTLSNHFQDIDQPSNTLTYSVQGNSNASVAGVALVGDQLTLTSKATGSTNITVRATDRSGKFIENTFTVTVQAQNTAPTTLNVPDQNVTVGATLPVELQFFFTDAQDGSAGLTYSLAGNSDPSVVSGSVTGTTLNLTGLKTGASILRVKATDRGGLFVESTFTVTVKGDQAPKAVLEVNKTNTLPGQYLTFSAGKSSDDVGISGYQLDFGDGRVITKSGVPGDIEHYYNKFGTYDAVLKVFDTANNMHTQTVQVTVGSVPGFTLNLQRPFTTLDVRRALVTNLAKTSDNKLMVEQYVCVKGNNCDFAVYNSVKGSVIGDTLTVDWFREKHFNSFKAEEMYYQFFFGDNGDRYMYGNTFDGGLTMPLTRVDTQGNTAWTRTMQLQENNTQLGATVQYGWKFAFVGGDNGFIEGGMANAYDTESKSAALGYVRKHNLQGDVVWTKFIGGPLVFPNCANPHIENPVLGLAEDAQGSVYVGVMTYTTTTKPSCDLIDIATVPSLYKFDAAGNQLWKKEFPELQIGSSPVAFKMLHHNGTVFMAIPVNNGGQYSQVHVVNAATGALKKSAAVGNPALFTEANKLIPAPDGNVYMVGTTSDSLGQIVKGGYDAFVLKSDLDGNMLFVKHYDFSRPDFGTREGVSDAVTIGETTFIAGHVQGTSGMFRIDASGNLLK